MVSSNPDRRDDLIVMLLHGGAATPAIAERVVDSFANEARAEELGTELNPSNLVLDAQAYRTLRDAIFATMDDPDRWDGDDDEATILTRYVQWLAAGRPNGEEAAS
jgi:hypothetical protein